MKKLRLIAVRSQQEELLRELMLLGCVEISQPDEEDAALPGVKSAAGGDLFRLRAEQSRLNGALKLLDKYAPAKKGLLTPLPEVSLDKLLDESALEGDVATAEHILSLDVEIRRVAAEESRERSLQDSLTPWLGLDLPLERFRTERCDVLLGTVPAGVAFSSAAEALGGAVEEAELYELGADKVLRYLELVTLREVKEDALAALHPLGWAPAALTVSTGTAQENYDASCARLEALGEEKAGYVAELAALGSEREALQLGVDTLSTRIARAESEEKLLDTVSTFTFRGWVPECDEGRLAEVLAKYDCAWETEDPDPDEVKNVPIQLRNNSLTRPMNLVTEMYSLPAYNGLDPNPFIMPFFALFFGIMFADMAYGLILLAAGLLVTFKAKPRGGMKNMAGLLIECGITTFLMGFLTGGCFGDVVSVIGGWFGKDWHVVPHLGTIRLGSIAINLPLNLMEGNNPLYVLIGAVALGGVHLAVGVGIGMYLKIREGQWLDALLNDLCWWVILAGLGLMVLGKGTVVLWIGVGMMVLGNVLTNKGLGRITGIFGAVYNGATGYLGDFLSYSRLMALMLAGSVIASVFNQLGSLGNAKGMTVIGTILFVLVFCIGHVLNFGLNLIGCFVHTLRLQYLEFFGKWYRDGGRPFRPLSIQTKFVDIIKEE